MTVGWIKLHRQMTQWEWYHDSETLHLFLHLLLTANREDGRWQGVEVRRGQRVAGRQSLSKETGISERTIRTSLERLKSTSELTIRTTNRFSLITVNKYDEYQSKEKGDQQNAQPAANKRPATDHKQEGEERKEFKKKAPHAKMTDVTDERSTTGDTEARFKRCVVGHGWCDEHYADKTWAQGTSMDDREEFLRKVRLLLAWANVPSRVKKARVLYHEIAGFVNDRGAMRQRLTETEQLERDEFSEV